MSNRRRLRTAVGALHLVEDPRRPRCPLCRSADDLSVMDFDSFKDHCDAENRDVDWQMLEVYRVQDWAWCHGCGWGGAVVAS